MFGKKTGSENNGSNNQTPPNQDGMELMGGDSHLPAVIPAANQGSANSIVERQSSAVGFGAEAAESKKQYANITTEKINFLDKSQETPKFLEVKMYLINELVDKIDFAVMYQLSEEKRKQRIHAELARLIAGIEAPLTANQMAILKDQVVDEVLGFGPLEPLLRDSDVSDIMINTAKQVYIERQGKIYLTDITFMNEQHLMAVIQRIVTRVGRRIDEASPMVDARLPDGSRFNAIIPPLALDGALVSIRKFKEAKISLKDYVGYGSMTPQMAKFLEICANIRLNIIVSGGTGSGKTTMLNALSKHIDNGERVITIEDAAELQLMQPHVLRLETRPASNEGVGEVTQRQLVRNALRMRPDRIILGEIRGDEVIDVLTAMNTGHDGSLATIHSNSPRDCLARIENLVNMSGIKVSDASLRYQISSALQLIIQLQRMRDGKRRVTHIEEVVGREGDTIVTQTLFSYHASGIDPYGNLIGEFRSSGIRPKFAPKAEYFGRERELLETLDIGQR
jgi:pilus assembly protein CpaF